MYFHFFFSAFVLVSFSAMAQNEEGLPKRANTMAIGYGIGQYQNDFGLNLNITSPYAIKDRFALRTSGGIQWFEYYDQKTGRMEWSLYNAFKLGVVGVGGTIGHNIRLYGEGGAVMILPNKVFSGENMAWGGYGHFGFEFLMTRGTRTCVTYYVELGGIGKASRAEKLPESPIYSNGFTAAAGVRFHIF